jgi:hypothetical protein
VRGGEGRGYFLPFLGRARELRGAREGGRLVFALPEIRKGGVFWLEPSKGGRPRAPRRTDS